MPAAKMELLDEQHRRKIVKNLRRLDIVASSIQLLEQCGVECTDRRAVLDYLFKEYDRLYSTLWPDTPKTEESTS